MSDTPSKYQQAIYDAVDDLPEALFDLDIYCDGGYCNLDDAVSTLESARDLLIELRRLNPRLVPDGYDSAGRLRV